MRHGVIVCMAVLVLSGCSVKYGCKTPEGVSCKSISEVYGDQLKGRTSSSSRTGAVNDGFPDGMSAAVWSLDIPGENPVPIRSAPRILRVWMAPWIDDEGDLHQEGYLYVMVNSGSWILGLPEVVDDPPLGLERDPFGEPKFPESGLYPTERNESHGSE